MIELHCKKCNRYLKVQPKSTFIAEVVCPDRLCKYVNTIKVVNPKSSEGDIRYKFEVRV